jgi:hypothetical protein
MSGDIGEIACYRAIQQHRINKIRTDTATRDALAADLKFGAGLGSRMSPQPVYTCRISVTCCRS